MQDKKVAITPTKITEIIKLHMDTQRIPYVILGNTKIINMSYKPPKLATS